MGTSQGASAPSSRRRVAVAPPGVALALLFFCGLCGLCGCVTTTSVVRDRYANDQSCPEDQVTVDQESATHYRARGCAAEATYVCSAAAGFKGGVQCIQQGSPNPPGYREPEHPVLPPPDPRMAAPQ